MTPTTDIYSAAPPAAYTLSQLTTKVGNAVRRDPELQRAWVTAELSDLRQSGGHLYMELIEKTQSGQTVARLRANIWANQAPRILRKFQEATGRTLATGLKVMLYGQVTHHTLYGLSFNIGDIDPSYTLGDLERLRREILERLAREGVSEMNRRKELPMAPQKIAVISAEGAAGYGDFINQLAMTQEGFQFYPRLYPAVLQGEKTGPSVVAALEKIEETIDFWDAVVIIRGGGSTSDLNGFDNLELARKVATFAKPVIVGIGHERDNTVLDDLACVRCKTPTAVAAFLIDRLRQALAYALELGREVSRDAADRIAGDLRQLETLRGMLPSVVENRVSRGRIRLQQLVSGIPAVVSALTSREQSRIGSLGSAVINCAANDISVSRRRLVDLSERISGVAPQPLALQGRRLEYLEGMLKVLSPENTLRRGYSVTRSGGKAVTDPSSLKAGDEIETTLFGGKVRSKVSG